LRAGNDINNLRLQKLQSSPQSLRLLFHTKLLGIAASQHCDPNRRHIMKTFEGAVFTATALSAQMLLIAALVA
jgi:hypothetical protein